MKYISAYTLLVLVDKTPTKEDMKKVIESVGGNVDTEELNRVFNLLNGKQLHELMAQGTSKLATFSAPSGGAVAQQATTAAPKKEEKKKEEEEEVNLGGGGLFGDDEDW